ncbi:MAG: hypothetical protein ACNS61_16225, partial [Candidatus Wenzhouxiangella sp. M2_3B_020]
MSAFKWLAFALGIPLSAVLIAFTYAFTNPAVELLNTLSTSEESAQGIAWYSQFLDFLPLVVLLLLALMLVVGIITRRQSVGI